VGEAVGHQVRGLDVLVAQGDGNRRDPTGGERPGRVARRPVGERRREGRGQFVVSAWNTGSKPGASAYSPAWP
jgi:hypothetical protein